MGEVKTCTLESVGGNYIYMSVNRVPICAAVHFERCSALPEVEKYVWFFVNCVPWTKTI